MARWRAGKHSGAASYGGARLAWGPSERGQGRRGLCWRGGAGAVQRRTASEGAERGGVRGRGTELGCGLGCGSAVCWMAVLVWVSGGGDLAVARARAKVR